MAFRIPRKPVPVRSPASSTGVSRSTSGAESAGVGPQNASREAEDSIDKDSKRVFLAAQRCKGALEECLGLEQLMHHEWAENRLADFNLWAAGSGAFTSHTASLDHRLVSDQDTLNLVVKQLTLLHSCVELCQDVARKIHTGHIELAKNNEIDGSVSASEKHIQNDKDGFLAPEEIARPFTPWSDQSSSSVDGELLEASGPGLSGLFLAQSDVERVLHTLLQLTLAIRKAGSGPRFQKADRAYNPSDHLELRQYLEVTLQTRGSELGAPDLKADICGISPIQERLIDANLRRRNRFLYFQKHSQKLASARHEYHDNSLEHGLIPKAKSPGNERQDAIVSNPGAVPNTVPTHDRVSALTDTTASALATKVARVGAHIETPSQIALTQVTSVVAGKVVYPKPPILREGLLSFKCPCCCQTLPAMFHQKPLWKRHLMDDIRPYTCIIDECPKPNVFYKHQGDWANHIQNEHRKCWQCLLCSTPRTVPLLFPIVQNLLDHIKDVHSSTVTEEQLPTLVRNAMRPAPFGISRCPLCDTTGETDSDSLFQHIAEHIHLFALESLPWPDDRASGNYFANNDYFDDVSNDTSNRDNVSSRSDRDSDELSSLDFIKDDEPPRPEDPIDDVDVSTQPPRQSRLPEGSPIIPDNYSAFPKVTGENVPPSDKDKEAILSGARNNVLNSDNAETQLTWARDVLNFVEIAANASYEEARAAYITAMASESGATSAKPETPTIEKNLRDDAINIVVYLAEQSHPEAVYIRSQWSEFGKFGRQVDKKLAYTGYLKSAGEGWGRSEYRIGLLYENSNDIQKALEHYSRGVEKGDTASLYRMGIMKLFGQHDQATDIHGALELLKSSANTADEHNPQGAYVYGMLFARELPDVDISEAALAYDLSMARQYIEKAAYLGFAKAQLKMGLAYELCQLGCDFQPVLSLHYYHLAARQGEAEACIGVSRWFLFGHEHDFEKNEALAFKYARLSTRAQNPNGEFAMGYFYEIGIYVTKNLMEARKWYELAAEHGHQDAAGRIKEPILKANEAGT